MDLSNLRRVAGFVLVGTAPAAGMASMLLGVRSWWSSGAAHPVDAVGLAVLGAALIGTGTALVCPARTTPPSRVPGPAVGAAVGAAWLALLLLASASAAFRWERDALVGAFFESGASTPMSGATAIAFAAGSAGVIVGLVLIALALLPAIPRSVTRTVSLAGGAAAAVLLAGALGVVTSGRFAAPAGWHEEAFGVAEGEPIGYDDPRMVRRLADPRWGGEDGGELRRADALDEGARADLARALARTASPRLQRAAAVYLAAQGAIEPLVATLDAPGDDARDLLRRRAVVLGLAARARREPGGLDDAATARLLPPLLRWLRRAVERETAEGEGLYHAEEIAELLRALTGSDEPTPDPARWEAIIAAARAR